MAHFAKLDENNIVVFVTVGRDDDDENELSLRTGEIYKKTSYNTKGGVYSDTETNKSNKDFSFRKNFAGIGYFYDAIEDAFIPPKPYASWVLNKTTYLWEAPIPYPTDGQFYNWDETTVTWVIANIEPVSGV